MLIVPAELRNLVEIGCTYIARLSHERRADFSAARHLKAYRTMRQFLDRVANDLMPALLDRPTGKR
jgi:hypothetical protein